MNGAFWGGMLLALVIVQIVVIWSIRRHRDPSLKIDCDDPIDKLMPSLSGLTLGTAVAGNHVEVHENGAFFDVLIAVLIAGMPHAPIGVNGSSSIPGPATGHPAVKLGHSSLLSRSPSQGTDRTRM